MVFFLSKLFGGDQNILDDTPSQGTAVEYKGLIIYPNPISDGGQWRLAGVIIKQSDQGRLERHYVRADIFSSCEEAEDFSARKGKQIIDEQDERLFANGTETGRA